MVDKITNPPSQKDLIDKVNELVDDKQDTLVSGTNIKTINNTSILGSGNIDIQGGGSSYTAGTGIDITNAVISVTSDISTGAALGATAVQPSDLATKQDVLTSENAGNCINIAMGGSSGLLSEYQELEYLQSSGTQYIDTGVPLDDTMTIRIKYDFIRAGFVFGSRTSASSRYSGITNENSGVYNIRYGNTVIYNQNTTPTGTVDVVISPNGVVLNGETVSTTAYGDSFYAGNCYLFTTNANGDNFTGEYAINRIRRFTIDNVIDLVPCKRKSDDVLGMYDLVNDEFLPNAGTGTFIAGGDVEEITKISFVNDAGYITSADLQNALDGKQNTLIAGEDIEITENGLPNTYDRLSYIESTGIEYLIAPYKVNNKTKLYCRYKRLGAGGVSGQAISAVIGVTTTASPDKANFGIFRGVPSDKNFNRVGWGDDTTGSVIDIRGGSTVGIWYEIYFDLNNIYIDNTLVATSTTDPSTVWEAQYDLGIFARNSATVEKPFYGQISSVWAKEDDIYVLNLIPCKRKSDNVVGMYDTVSKTFLTNQNDTGAFVAGDIIPVSDDQVISFVNNAGYITSSALTPYVLSADLATVATSGSYNDLSNKPTIPSEVTESTVSGWGFTKNTGTVTSVNNVSPVNGNVTLSIPTVPTNVSAFTNDSGYITSSALTGYEQTSNKVTSISSSSTNTQYPSAKCVYDIVGDVETLINAL